MAHAASDEESNTGPRSMINGMSEAIQLNAREELIQRALEMTEHEATTVLKFIEQLEEVEDMAIVAERRGEPTVTLDELLNHLGFTREELMEGARADGLLR